MSQGGRGDRSEGRRESKDGRERNVMNKIKY